VGFNTRAFLRELGMRRSILLLSLFLITLAAPVQGQEPGQTARGWHSIGQNPPRLFEGILTADLDLETEDGLVISQEDLRDRTYFDVEQQIPTSAGVLIGAALGPVAVLIYEAGSGSGSDCVGPCILRDMAEPHNQHYWESSGSSAHSSGFITYALVTVGMAVLGGLVAESHRGGVWKGW
jgi:hypothetical protein